jgi:hypothetical protein
VLHGGAGVSESRSMADRLAVIPDDEDRVLLATGRYIGEGFDDSRQHEQLASPSVADVSPKLLVQFGSNSRSEIA